MRGRCIRVYPGQYYDQETGLHYNWHRYYDPDTGRYLTADPIGLAGGINPFVYTLNNPVNLIDPEGLMVLVDDLVFWTLVGVTTIVIHHYLNNPPAAPAWDDPWNEMASKGNVADSQIINDYSEYSANERCSGKDPKDRCAWLKENKNRYRKDQYKRTEKAWGCRRSRHNR